MPSIARWARPCRAAAAAALCLAVASSCGGGRVEVLRAATSPDGRYRAELHVLKDVAWATDADPLTVTVYALPRDDGDVVASGREAVPVPAAAGALALRWDGPRRLVLSCAACPAAPGPGSGRRPTSEQRWRDVVITFDAFPDDGSRRDRRSPVI